MRLACRLRELRRRRGLSLRDVEAATGIARTDLSKVERGRLLPRDDWIARLEHVYVARASTWYPPPAGAIAGVAIERDAPEMK